MAKNRIDEFEEQTVIGFSQKGRDILLELECWDPETDMIGNVLVTFCNVSDLKITGDSTLIIGMLGDDGENIHFEIDNHHCLLMIIWKHNKKSSIPETNVYDFNFEAMRVVRGKTVSRNSPPHHLKK